MQRRKRSREFKLDAARLIKARGICVAQASRDFDAHQTALRRWVKDFDGIGTYIFTS